MCGRFFNSNNKHKICTVDYPNKCVHFACEISVQQYYALTQTDHRSCRDVITTPMNLRSANYTIHIDH